MHCCKNNPGIFKGSENLLAFRICNELTVRDKAVIYSNEESQLEQELSCNEDVLMKNDILESL